LGYFVLVVNLVIIIFGRALLKFLAYWVRYTWLLEHVYNSLGRPSFIQVWISLIVYLLSSPWYKTEWSHLLSSGMQTASSENFSNIENSEPQKRFGETFMEIKEIFLWRVLFSKFKSFHCLQLHLTTQKWLHFVLYQGLQGVSLMFEGKVFCGEFHFQVFMSCWRIQQSVMNIFCILW